MTTLVESIYGLPTERLRDLVKARDIDVRKLTLIPSKRQLAQFLANELSRPPSITHALMQCTVRELRFLQLLLSGEADQVTSWRSILEIAGGPSVSEAMEKIVRRLEELGLAFRTEQGVFVPNAVRIQVPASLSDRSPLAKCLQMYDVLALRRICDTLELSVKSGTKSENIAALCTHLLQSGTPLRLRSPLTAEEVQVLEYLIQAGGVATATDVASAVFGGQTEDFFRYDWQNRWKQGRERNAVDTLLARGMLFVVSHGFAYNLFLVIPGDLLRILTGGGDNAFWTSEEAAPEPLPEPPVSVTVHTTLVRDVITLFSFVATQEATRTSTGYIHKSNLKNLARMLTLPGERYAAFVYAVCREAGLITVIGEKHHYTITERGRAWFGWDSNAQLRTLYQAWLEGTFWAEMYSDPLHRANEYRARDPILGLRHAALGALTESAVGVFYSPGSLIDVLTFRSPLLLVQSAQTGDELVSSPTSFVRNLIGECLFWLGSVELGWGEGSLEKGLSAPAATVRGKPAQPVAAPDPVGYRLNPLGAYLLGIQGAKPPEESPRENSFIVQANAEIFVPPYLEPGTLYRLLKFTEVPLKAGTGNTVSLTRDSIRRALDQGESPTEMLRFLQAHSRTGVPQNVEYLIQEVGGKHGHIHIGKAQMYLQVETPLLLKELQARREFKDYFVRALSDTVAILKAEDPHKLLRELRKAGYLPVSDDEATPVAATPVEPSVPLPQTSLEAEERKKRLTQTTDTVLDWNRIAQEDNQSWNASPAADGAPTPRTNTLKPPNDAVRQPELIRFILAQAVRDQKCVELAYLAQEESVARAHVIESHRFMGDFFSGLSRLTQRAESFNVNRIEWARLTGEKFA